LKQLLFNKRDEGYYYRKFQHEKNQEAKVDKIIPESMIDDSQAETEQQA
jgi:hypothetical protein